MSVIGEQIEDLEIAASSNGYRRTSMLSSIQLTQRPELAISIMISSFQSGIESSDRSVRQRRSSIHLNFVQGDNLSSVKITPLRFDEIPA